MSLLKVGKNIFHSNVSNITEFGFWLLVADKEYFVPFELYPAFKHAPVDEIFSVEQLSPTQFHWKKLDCDIELTALENPSQYPLQYTD